MTKPEQQPAITRPEDVLADDINRTEIGGLSIRKGTVAAFLQNAMRWSDPATDDAQRDALSREIAQAVPSLRALGVFDVLDIRDERLRVFIAGC